MLVESYKNHWLRYLRACAAAEGGHLLSCPRDEIIACLNACQEGPVLYKRFWRVAVALGIAKPAVFAWQDAPTAVHGDKECGQVFWDPARRNDWIADVSFEAESKTWCADWYPKGSMFLLNPEAGVEVRVIGHPTRATAIDHLQRLAGRYPAARSKKRSVEHDA